MNNLTEDEINFYLCSENKSTGVHAITREDIEAINLDDVRDVIKVGDRMTDTNGNQLFKLDRFTPISGSYAFKPSFAGNQVLLGKEGRKLYFSNGRWFSSSF